MNSTHEQIRTEMSQIQNELQAALDSLISDTGNRLKPDERAEIEEEFTLINELIERLKTGLVWIALFGRTSVGKSAIANALMGEDFAQVGIEHDLTTEPQPYEKAPWMLVDVPGILGKQINETVALDEAQKAHGHILVVEGEPFEDELELFELVHEKTLHTPKIVFVNKWDIAQATMVERDQQIVKNRVREKMGRFVKSDRDIIYGSAMLKVGDRMVRQELPQLLDRMYEDAGTLGQVMNVLDPANRAADVGSRIREKIFEVRTRLARKVISAFATASVVGGFVPFAFLIVTPGVLAGLVFTLFRIMGRKEGKAVTKDISVALLKACGAELGSEFVANVVAEAFLGGLFVIPVFGPLIGFGGLAATGYYRYRRTAILGEVTIEYIKNDCSWGAEGAHATILRCRERAMQHYMRLRNA